MLGVEVMIRHILIFLGVIIIVLFGTLIISVIFPPEKVWEHVQDIESDEYLVLEIIATKGWSTEERWRIYTLDMEVDPSSWKRPIVSLGHEGDLILSLFKGLRHNDKFQTQDGVLEESDRMVYRVPIEVFSKMPVRLWAWSGKTGYIFRINGIELKEKKSVRVSKNHPYIYYVLKKSPNKQSNAESGADAPPPVR